MKASDTTGLSIDERGGRTPVFVALLVVPSVRRREAGKTPGTDGPGLVHLGSRIVSPLHVDVVMTSVDLPTYITRHPKFRWTFGSEDEG